MEMTALGNSRTLLSPVDYPSLSSLASWSDAAAAAAVGYSYPRGAAATAPGTLPSAHYLVYGGGGSGGGGPTHPYGCAVTADSSSCSMYSSWRYHPAATHSAPPLSFYYQADTAADWILRQSKLESQLRPFSHHQQQQQQQQQGPARWKVASPRRDVATTSTTTPTVTRPSSICRLQFDSSGDARSAAHVDKIIFLQ